MAASIATTMARGLRSPEVLQVKRLTPTAALPVRSSVHAAGFDLAAAEAAVVPVGGKAIVKTGLAVAVPEGTYARIAPRSGLAAKRMINVGAGVVDYDYRGEVGVVLFNHGDADFDVAVGDRVAQLILEKVDMAGCVEVESLSETARGAGGYGSTGVAAQEHAAIGKRELEAEAPPEASVDTLPEAVSVKRLKPTASMPVRGSVHAAGFDLSAAEAVVAKAGGKAVVKTGLAIAIPEGTYARVAPRSGLAAKRMIQVGAGVIDYDYRGEVGVVLFNHGSEDFEVSAGDRIAQLILEKVAMGPCVEVSSLDDTARGAGGFGSTGVAETVQVVDTPRPLKTLNAGHDSTPQKTSSAGGAIEVASAQEVAALRRDVEALKELLLRQQGSSAGC